jgi:hypothetical protein
MKYVLSKYYELAIHISGKLSLLSEDRTNKQK